MFRRSFGFLFVFLVLAVAGCSSGKFPIGVVERGAFRHVTYDYVVEVERESGELMGADWRLDNYMAPASGPGLGAPKDTGDYISRISLDHDGDDRPDVRTVISTYDLLFKHRRNDGRMFLSTFPISQYDSDRELSVMLRDYVESASHAGRITHNYQAGTSRASAQMASRVLASRPVSVDGFPAHEVIFEVANVQQLELTPDARWERGHVVLVRTEFVFSDEQFARQVSVSQHARQRRARTFYPVLMVIGYSNHPDEYDAHHPDFQSLVSRIRMGGTLDNQTLRGHATGCGADQLDVIISGDHIAQWSLDGSTPEGSCLGSHVVRARFPSAEWVRTLSLRSPSTRAADRTTTAGSPTLAPQPPADTTPPTAGGENPVVPPPATPDTTDSTATTPAGI